MAGIVDKGVLLLLGIVLTGQTSGSAAGPVVAMLIGIIAAALGSYISDYKYRSVYMAAFVLGCFFLPELLFFLPLVFYDCAMDRRMWPVFGSAPVLGLYYGSGERMDVYGLGIWTAFLLLAVVLGRRTGRLGYLEQEMIRLRDTSTELNLVLREKNKNLMEKQDYEIYLATLKERNRIAREIHDNVGHMLSRSILQVGALGTIHREEPLHGQLGSINDTLNQAMNSIRESVHDLHNDSIDLKQAVMEATRTMGERYQITIDYDMSPEVPRNVKYCFVTTVKEAMSNIVKHSNGDRVTLILREHPGFYQLTVEDNGTAGNDKGSEVWRGDAQSLLSGDEGIGLNNMKERVEALRGTFRIRRDRGFLIFISIPKSESAAGGMEV